MLVSMAANFSCFPAMLDLVVYRGQHSLEEGSRLAFLLDSILVKTSTKSAMNREQF